MRGLWKVSFKNALCPHWGHFHSETQKAHRSLRATDTHPKTSVMGEDLELSSQTPSSYKWKEPWPSRSLTSPDHSRRHRQMECLFPKAFPAETCSLLLWGHDLFTGISLWARRGGPQPWTQEEELNSQPRNLRVTSRSLLQNHLFSSLPQCLNFHRRLSVPWVTAQKTAVKM